MIDRPAGPLLDGDTPPRVGVDGIDGSGDATNNDFCATLLAMASHELRQPLQMIVGAHHVLAPNPPRQRRAGTAGSGRGCHEATGRQSLRPPASRVDGRRRTRDRREACSRWRAISRLDVTPSRGWATAKVASAVAERREVAAAWLLCVFIAVLALGATSGLLSSEPPAATVANKTAIRWHMRAVCTPPLPCAEGNTAILEPW
jgi:hypothetical protein